ncbi:hypothetical protein HDU98_000121, partial [Podochytrium sp. JEL0797]
LDVNTLPVVDVKKTPFEKLNNEISKEVLRVKINALNKIQASDRPSPGLLLSCATHRPLVKNLPEFEDLEWEETRDAETGKLRGMWTRLSDQERETFEVCAKEPVSFKLLETERANHFVLEPAFAKRIQDALVRELNERETGAVDESCVRETEFECLYDEKMLCKLDYNDEECCCFEDDEIAYVDDLVLEKMDEALQANGMYFLDVQKKRDNLKRLIFGDHHAAFKYRGSQFSGCGYDSDSGDSDDNEATKVPASVLATTASQFEARLLKTLSPETAELFASLLFSAPTKGTATAESFYSKTAPRQMNEHLSLLLHLKPNDYLVKWEFDSEWLWISEAMHDAHLSESYLQTLHVAGKCILRVKRFEKPSHEFFGGGKWCQERVWIMWDALEEVKAFLFPASADIRPPPYSSVDLLLFLACLGVHTGLGGQPRRSLVEVLLEHREQLAKAHTENTSEIVLSDNDGFPKVTEDCMFGAEDDADECRGDSGSPHKKMRPGPMPSLQENIDHAMALSEEGRLNEEAEMEAWDREHEFEGMASEEDSGDESGSSGYT